MGAYPPSPKDERFAEWLLSETADWATTLEFAKRHQDWEMVASVLEDLKKKCQLFAEWIDEERKSSLTNRPPAVE